jgi:hypothetical protein
VLDLAFTRQGGKFRSAWHNFFSKLNAQSGQVEVTTTDRSDLFFSIQEVSSDILREKKCNFIRALLTIASLIFSTTTSDRLLSSDQDFSF